MRSLYSRVRAVSPRPLGVLDPGRGGPPGSVARRGRNDRRRQHAARSPRSRCGPGRNRDRYTPARTTIRLGAEKQPRMRQIAVAATVALIMRAPLAWTRAVDACDTDHCKRASARCRARRRSKNCQVMGRRRACLPIPEGYYRTSAEFPGAQPVARTPTRLPRGVHRRLPPPPLRCARRALRSAGGARLWTTWTILAGVAERDRSGGSPKRKLRMQPGIHMVSFTRLFLSRAAISIMRLNSPSE